VETPVKTEKKKKVKANKKVVEVKEEPKVEVNKGAIELSQQDIDDGWNMA
jgi:hypothetical protein